MTVARGLHDIVVTRALLIKVFNHGCMQRLVIIVVACTPARDCDDLYQLLRSLSVAPESRDRSNDHYHISIKSLPVAL